MREWVKWQKKKSIDLQLQLSKGVMKSLMWHRVGGLWQDKWN